MRGTETFVNDSGLLEGRILRSSSIGAAESVRRRPQRRKPKGALHENCAAHENGAKHENYAKHENFAPHKRQERRTERRERRHHHRTKTLSRLLRFCS